jgi:hypothetical protein
MSKQAYFYEQQLDFLMAAPVTSRWAQPPAGQGDRRSARQQEKYAVRQRAQRWLIGRVVSAASLPHSRQVTRAIASISVCSGVFKVSLLCKPGGAQGAQKAQVSETFYQSLYLLIFDIQPK